MSAAALGVSTSKQELLRLLLEEAGVEASSDSLRIPRRADRGPALLSFAQRRLWFLDQLVPESSFYNIHNAVPLPFAVNAEVLERTLNEIVRRHETLRTTFRLDDGEPVQVIAEELHLPLRRVDLSDLPAGERQARAQAVATEEAQQPFDLASGPLLRTTLVTLGPVAHVLLATFHHIVSDAWSLGVFLQELRALYESILRSLPAPLPELEIQYSDFAVWQRQRLRGEYLEEQLAYWRERLTDVARLDLPTDRPRPGFPSFAGASCFFTLPADLVSQLRSLARSEDCTLFMVCLAAFKLLLHRYTGERDVVVGTPIANRNQKELEPLIGFFVNTLVIRTDASGSASVRQYLGQVRRVTLGAYDHQDLPFEKLVEEIQPDRDLSRNPLFQVVFQLHNEPAGDLEAAAPGFEVPHGLLETAPFDLVVDLWQSGREIVGRFCYATDLFEASTVERFSHHYRQLLRGMVADPDQPLASLPLLRSKERRQLVVDWNATEVPYPRDAAVHHLFEDQVDRAPEAIALVFGHERLTYWGLDRRANRLAHALRRRGVSADRAVGLVAERSSELIVGLLGILKAGGAYVALDPEDPPRRLVSMLRDAGAALVVTPEPWRPMAEELGFATLSLAGAARPAEAPTPDGGRLPRDGRDAGPDNLAYVAFTSGSTGEPKGVAVVHRAVARLVRGADYVRCGPGEVFLQLSPVSFDASTFEIWGCLANGSRLVVHPPEPPSLDQLARTLAAGGVTTLWLTAGLFHQMVDAEPESLSGVRQLLAGGDVLSVHHVRRILERPGERRVVNGYGPTEGTTFTTCFVMDEPSQVGPSVPIGRPIANTRVYVLDPGLGPVPVGVPGELFIGGAGLARGYLGRPRPTAESFVPDPFAARLGERLYRTGDRVRYRDDSRLEFCGRIDRQVKVRGFRIEPAEVEAALCRRPGIREAVVLAHGDASGDKRLCAYLVAADEGPPPVDELRVALGQGLPSFMVPSVFFFLDALPLTPNGKVDARALARLGEGERERRGHYVAPSSDVERALAAIWEEVLGIDKVGVYDDFFIDLGGHSLLGTLLVSRVREGFGIELPLQRLFEAPQIAQLALLIEDVLLAEIESLEDGEAETVWTSQAR